MVHILVIYKIANAEVLTGNDMLEKKLSRLRLWKNEGT